MLWLPPPKRAVPLRGKEECQVTINMHGYAGLKGFSSSTAYLEETSNGFDSRTEGGHRP
jgi:hypothetical protein